MRRRNPYRAFIDPDALTGRQTASTGLLGREPINRERPKLVEGGRAAYGCECEELALQYSLSCGLNERFLSFRRVFGVPSARIESLNPIHEYTVKLVQSRG